MSSLRFAIFGTGFWSRFQLAAWQQLAGVECVAVYNRTRSRAEILAREFNVPAVYDDPEALLDHEQLDFIDIITDVDTHSRFVNMAAAHKLPVICQKPMAPTLAIAESMVDTCKAAGIPFFIHENFRWQTPIRALKQVLTDNQIGPVFRAQLDFSNSFDVFANQPFLRDLDQFILTDVGSHILDVARFLFGEASTLYCRTDKVHHDIKGEDVATVQMQMAHVNTRAATVTCQMAYAGSPREHDRFPETYITVEGELGTAQLGPDYRIRVTTKTGTHVWRCPPPRYAWADPAYDLVHASILPCNADILRALQTGTLAETHAVDNLNTVRLVFNSYESARTGRVIDLAQLIGDRQ